MKYWDKFKRLDWFTQSIFAEIKLKLILRMNFFINVVNEIENMFIHSMIIFYIFRYVRFFFLDCVVLAEIQDVNPLRGSQEKSIAKYQTTPLQFTISIKLRNTSIKSSNAISEHFMNHIILTLLCKYQSSPELDVYCTV